MEIVLKNGRKIGDNHPAYIIAEIGINHNGSIDIAKKLVEKASIIGIDAVKFQKRTIEEMYRSDFLKMPYIKDNSFGETYGKHKHFLEFTNDRSLIHFILHHPNLESSLLFSFNIKNPTPTQLHNSNVAYGLNSFPVII